MNGNTFYKVTKKVVSRQLAHRSKQTGCGDASQPDSSFDEHRLCFALCGIYLAGLYLAALGPKLQTSFNRCDLSIVCLPIKTVRLSVATCCFWLTRVDGVCQIKSSRLTLFGLVLTNCFDAHTEAAGKLKAPS